MEEADAFLFTSVRDTSGNVVLEAMSHSIPVVAINHQGIREICEPNTAMLIEPSDIRATALGLAGSLRALKNDPDLASEIGKAGFQHLRSHHSWNRYGEEMFEIYRQTLKKESHSGQ